MAAATRTRPDGGPEVVVDPSSGVFRPARWEFADMADLAGYLCEVFDARSTAGGGVTGSMSRKGQYVRRRADGARAFTFGDPILDQVTSPLGEIVIAGRPMDLTRPDAGVVHQGGTVGGRTLTVSTMAGNLLFTGEDGGVERWASPDGTKVEYRAGNASMTFRAWRKSTWYGYWSMGAEISTRGSIFEAANINSRYYITAIGQVCAVLPDEDSDTNDDYVDEYEWGWHAEQPHRVESLCRAQWNGSRFGDVVAAGHECFAENVQPWPTGWPEDWPPDTGAEVQPSRLRIMLRSVGLVGRATAIVINHNPTPMGVIVEDAEGALFSNPTGTFTIPANGRLPVTVSFDAERTGIFGSRLHIRAGGQSYVVPITATVTQVGPSL